jgi:hypothetical protein
MTFGSPFIGRLLEIGWPRDGEAAFSNHNAQRDPETPTPVAFQVVFIGKFCECEEVSFAAGYSSALFSGDHHVLAGANFVLRLATDHVAHRLAALPAIDLGLVVRMHGAGRASARRNGVVHFRSIEAAAHADDHANHLH